MDNTQSPKKETPFLEQHHLEHQNHMIATHVSQQQMPPQPQIPYVQQIIIIQQIPRPPLITYCHYCNMETDTYETFYDGAFVWLMCLLLWFFTLFFFWIAFCIPDWKDEEYRCVRCDRVKFVKEGSCC